MQRTIPEAMAHALLALPPSRSCFGYTCVEVFPDGVILRTRDLWHWRLTTDDLGTLRRVEKVTWTAHRWERVER